MKFPFKGTQEVNCKLCTLPTQTRREEETKVPIFSTDLYCHYCHYRLVQTDHNDYLLTTRTEMSENTSPPPPPRVPDITMEPEDKGIGEQFQRCGWSSSITSAKKEYKILKEEDA